jgi:hypothetical protein
MNYNPQITRYADLTSYPNIFRKSYWGYFKVNRDSIYDEQIVIAKNRDNFVEQFKIVQMLDRKERYATLSKVCNDSGWDIRDHIEYYKSEDNLVVAIFTGHQYLDIIKDCGYVLTDPLYASDQLSFVKTFIYNNNAPTDKPRITKQIIKDGLPIFAVEAIDCIIQHIVFNNDTEKFYGIHNDYFYRIYKTTTIINPEIHITRSKFDFNNMNILRDNRGYVIYEEAYVYKENMNRQLCDNTDHGFIHNGFSVQNYRMYK